MRKQERRRSKRDNGLDVAKKDLSCSKDSFPSSLLIFFFFIFVFLITPSSLLTPLFAGALCPWICAKPSPSRAYFYQPEVILHLQDVLLRPKYPIRPPQEPQLTADYLYNCSTKRRARIRGQTVLPISGQANIASSTNCPNLPRQHTFWHCLPVRLEHEIGANKAAESVATAAHDSTSHNDSLLVRQ